MCFLFSLINNCLTTKDIKHVLYFVAPAGASVKNLEYFPLTYAWGQCKLKPTGTVQAHVPIHRSTPTATKRSPGTIFLTILELDHRGY